MSQLIIRKPYIGYYTIQQPRQGQFPMVYSSTGYIALWGQPSAGYPAPRSLLMENLLWDSQLQNNLLGDGLTGKTSRWKVDTVTPIWHTRGREATKATAMTHTCQIYMLLCIVPHSSLYRN